MGQRRRCRVLVSQSLTIRIGVIFLTLYILSLWISTHHLMKLDAEGGSHPANGDPQRYKNRNGQSRSSTKRAVSIPITDWSFSDWKNHVDKLSEEWKMKSAETPWNLKPITAYVEPSWNVSIPGTGHHQDVSEGPGIPQQYYEPLPLRTQSPQDLRKVSYPKVQSCWGIPSQLPVDQGIQYNPLTGEPIPVTNTGDQPTPPDFLETILEHCPVDVDPYLPWIHDIFLDLSPFPSKPARIQFVAQNKRRCQTGSLHGDDLERLEPQVALLQSVSVKRLSSADADNLAPELWKPTNHHSTHSPSPLPPRYRLAPYEEADADGKYTRFICRFHTWQTNIVTGADERADPPVRLDLGETLSEYPLNYELAAYRKRNNGGGLLTKNGKDNVKFWTASLLFSCPLPKHVDGWMKEGHSGREEFPWTLDTLVHVTRDGPVPLLHVDIVPIRTPVRFPTYKTALADSEEEDEDDDGEDGGYYLSKEQVGSKLLKQSSFNASKAWGHKHILPVAEASGRWENLPICPLSKTLPKIDQSSTEHGVSKPRATVQGSEQPTQSKPHLLTACLWAAASFRTRGKGANQLISNTKKRLKEWIEFHLMVGFDKIYVYDNSGAFGNLTNLEDITSIFPSHQVTRIDWPNQVCNNNIPAHDNTGERSSQYAAENSCRTRYGPYSEWIASFDTDEYLVPMGKHKTLRSVVEGAVDTNILSFRSSRGKLRETMSENVGKGREKLSNVTFLQAFNCDGSAAPRPSWADRARKQLYRADYVLNHFVHYSTVTKGYMLTHKEAKDQGLKWKRYYQETSPSERATNELDEATMIHTKSLDQAQTRNWENRCKFDFPKKHLGCHIGFPWPNNTEGAKGEHDVETGWAYNCFVNEAVERFWIPRLQRALAIRESVHY